MPASSCGWASPFLGMFLCLVCLAALCGAFMLMLGALYFEDLKLRAYSLGQQLRAGLFWRKM